MGDVESERVPQGVAPEVTTLIAEGEAHGRQVTPLPDSDDQDLGAPARELGQSPEAEAAAEQVVEAGAELSALETQEAEQEAEAEKKEEELESVDADMADAEAAAEDAKTEEIEALKEKKEAEKAKVKAEAELRDTKHKERELERGEAQAERMSEKTKQELANAEEDFHTRSKELASAKAKFQNATEARAQAQSKMEELKDTLGLSEAAWGGMMKDLDAAKESQQKAMEKDFAAKAGMSKAEREAAAAKAALGFADQKAKDSEFTSDEAAGMADQTAGLLDATRTAEEEAAAARIQLDKDKDAVLKMGAMLMDLEHASEEDKEKAQKWAMKAGAIHGKAALMASNAKAAAKAREARQAAALEAQMAAEKGAEDFANFEDYVTHITQRTKELEAEADIAKQKLSKAETKVKTLRRDRERHEKVVHGHAKAEIPAGTDIEKAQELLKKKKVDSHESIEQLHKALDKEHAALEELKMVQEETHTAVPMAENSRKKLEVALEKAALMEKEEKEEARKAKDLSAAALKADKEASDDEAEAEKLEAEAAEADGELASSKAAADEAQAAADEEKAEEDEAAKGVVDELKDMAKEIDTDASLDIPSIEAILDQRDRFRNNTQEEKEQYEKRKQRAVAKEQALTDELAAIANQVDQLVADQVGAEQEVAAAQEQMNTATPEQKAELADGLKQAQMKRLSATQALEDMKVTQTAKESELEQMQEHQATRDEYEQTFQNHNSTSEAHFEVLHKLSELQTEVEVREQEIKTASDAQAAAQAELEQAGTPEDREIAEASLKQAVDEQATAQAALKAARDERTAIQEEEKAAKAEKRKAKNDHVQVNSKQKEAEKVQAAKLVEEAKQVLSTAKTPEEKATAQEAVHVAELEREKAAQEADEALEDVESQAEQEQQAFVEASDEAAKEAAKDLNEAARMKRSADNALSRAVEIYAKAKESSGNNSTEDSLEYDPGMEKVKFVLESARTAAATEQRYYDDAKAAFGAKKEEADTENEEFKILKLSNKAKVLQREADSLVMQFGVAEQAVSQAKILLQEATDRDAMEIAKADVEAAQEDLKLALKEKNTAEAAAGKAETKKEAAEAKYMRRSVLNQVKKLMKLEDEKVLAEQAVAEAQTALDNLAPDTDDTQKQTATDSFETAKAEYARAGGEEDRAKLAYRKAKEMEAVRLKEMMEAQATRQLAAVQRDLDAKTLTQATALVALNAAQDRMVAAESIADYATARQVLVAARTQKREADDAKSAVLKAMRAKIKSIEEEKVRAVAGAAEEATRKALLLEQSQKKLEVQLKEAEIKMAQATSEVDKLTAGEALSGVQAEVATATNATQFALDEAANAKKAAYASYSDQEESKLSRLRLFANEESERLDELNKERVAATSDVEKAQKLLAGAEGDDELAQAEKLLEKAKLSRTDALSSLERQQEAAKVAQEMLEAAEEQAKLAKENEAKQAAQDALSEARLVIADRQKKKDDAFADMEAAQEGLAAAKDAEGRSLAEARLKIAEKQRGEAMADITAAKEEVKQYSAQLKALKLAVEKAAHKDQSQKLDQEFADAMKQSTEAAALVAEKVAGQQTATREIEVAEEAIGIADTPELKTEAEAKLEEAKEELNSAEATLQASQASATEANAALLAKVSDQEAHEDTMLRRLMLELRTTPNGPRKDEVEKELLDTKQKQVHRTAAVMAMLPNEGEEKWALIKRVEALKEAAADIVKLAAESMEEGPEKAAKLAEVRSQREVIINDARAHLNVMPDEPAKTEAMSELDIKEESLLEEARAAIEKLPEGDQRATMMAELIEKEKTMLAKQEDKLEAMPDSPEKDAALAKIAVKNAMLYPDKQSAAAEELESARAAEEKAEAEAVAKAMGDAAAAREKAEMDVAALKEEEAAAMTEASSAADDAAQKTAEEQLTSIQARLAAAEEVLAGAERGQEKVEDAEFIKKSAEPSGEPQSAEQRMGTMEAVTGKLAKMSKSDREAVFDAKKAAMEKQRKWEQDALALKRKEVEKLNAFKELVAQQKSAKAKKKANESKTKMAEAKEAADEATQKRKEFMLSTLSMMNTRR